jgi:hypothetical protein
VKRGTASDPLIDVGVHGTTPEKLRALQEHADRIIEGIEQNQRAQERLLEEDRSRWRREAAAANAAEDGSSSSSASGAAGPPPGSIPDVPAALIRAASRDYTHASRPARRPRGGANDDASSSSSQYSMESGDEHATPSLGYGHGRGQSSATAASLSKSSVGADERSFDDGEFTMVSLPSTDGTASFNAGSANGGHHDESPTKGRRSASNASTPSRGQSHKLKRPPPGRMMSAAEMDASDEEYEPGE